ncbi:MAG: hypothetical protein R2854_18185 [Caldilineaceae bacterium]
MDGWSPGDPPYPGDFPPPQPTLYQFGRLWADGNRIEALGWATTETPTDFTAVEQRFSGGTLIANLGADGSISSARQTPLTPQVRLPGELTCLHESDYGPGAPCKRTDLFTTAQARGTVPVSARLARRRDAALCAGRLRARPPLAHAHPDTRADSDTDSHRNPGSRW